MKVRSHLKYCNYVQNNQINENKLKNLEDSYKVLISEKTNQIDFLRNKLNQCVAELQTEIANRDKIIDERVKKVEKLRDDDLQNYIQSKEEIERKIQDKKEVKNIDILFYFQNKHSLSSK